LEELWAFNDERVARAIDDCRHPVISGVGHETDFTIADFVADLRAPTPSVAAELAVPDQAELRQRIGAGLERLVTGTERKLTQVREVLGQQQRDLRRLSPQTRVDSHRQQVDDLSQRASQTLDHVLALHRSELAGRRARLAALSPLGTLARGYAIVREADNGEVVHSVGQVAAGDELLVRVQDGEFGAVTQGERHSTKGD
jgi:exodeoxyribonuclease VII large subunit